jgi:hypothetical protein
MIVEMSAWSRLAVAALVAALVASPVVLDACLFTCHESTDIAASQSEPSCHHVDASSDTRVEAPASACGHDHSPAPPTMTERDRGLDGRCDVGFADRDSPPSLHLANPDSLAVTVVARIPFAYGRASTPLRI